MNSAGRTVCKFNELKLFIGFLIKRKIQPRSEQWRFIVEISVGHKQYPIESVTFCRFCINRTETS